MKRLLMTGLMLGLFTTLVQADDPQRGYLGIFLGPVDSALVKHLQLEQETGVMVLKVIEESPAAGVLEQDDILLKLNGEAIGEVAGFTELIGSMQPGQKVTLDLLRSGKPLSVEVILGERPKDQEKHMQWAWTDDDGEIMGGYAPKIYIGNEGLPPDLEKMLQEIIEEGQGGTVKVEIKCENGTGTLTIDRSNGWFSTETFDCPQGTPGEGVQQKRIMKFHAGHPLMLDKEFKIELPEIDLDVPGYRMMPQAPNWCSAKPRTSFRLLSSGKIEVTTRKGDNELTQEFENEQDLSSKAPELFEKYTELQSTE